MTVTIKINREVIDEVRIRNRGPVGGPDGASFDPGDYEGGNGLRQYEWNSRRGSGSLLHSRGDGAVALAAAVLEAMV